MAIFAQIADGKVVNRAVFGDEPHEGWVDLSGLAPEPQIGWSYDGTVFTAPVEPAPAPVTRYDFRGFLGLFTADEQGAIVNATDTQVRVLCLIGAGTNVVDLTDARTIQDVDHLESLGLIAEGRAAQVLAGLTPSAA
jgi:hypothetical protein